MSASLFPTPGIQKFPHSRLGGKPSCWEDWLTCRGLIWEQEEHQTRMLRQSPGVGTTYQPQPKADGPTELNIHQPKKQNKWVTLKPEPVQRKTLGSGTLLSSATGSHVSKCQEENRRLEFYLDTGSIYRKTPLQDNGLAWASLTGLSLIFYRAI